MEHDLPLSAAIALHLEALRTGGYAPATVGQRTWALGWFERWAAERGLEALSEVTAEVLARYQRHLFERRRENPDGTASQSGLALRTQRARLVPLRTFGRWLKRRGHLPANPAEELVMPRSGQYLPKSWLGAAEAEAVLAAPQRHAARRPVVALRDRAILETLYSTGLRRLELIRLQRHQIDFAEGTLVIRQGKGGKDRVIAIGERALSWISQYLAEARPRLARRGGGTCGEIVFLTERGRPIAPKYLSALVTAHVKASGIEKAGSCHLFRHTCATLMLENGADIRHVQEQLGHACLSTTQIYTHVSIRKLKDAHNKTHPGAKLAPATVATSQAPP